MRCPYCSLLPIVSAFFFYILQLNNVLVLFHGGGLPTAKLTDFGCARRLVDGIATCYVTQSTKQIPEVRSAIGTLATGLPDQVRCITPATDVWLLSQRVFPKLLPSEHTLWGTCASDIPCHRPTAATLVKDLAERLERLQSPTC